MDHVLRSAPVVPKLDSIADRPDEPCFIGTKKYCDDYEKIEVALHSGKNQYTDGNATCFVSEGH